MPKSYQAAALRSGGETPSGGFQAIARDEALELIEMMQSEFPALRAEVRWTPRAEGARCYDRRVLINLGPKTLAKGERELLHEIAHALVLAEYQARGPHGPIFASAIARVKAAYYGEEQPKALALAPPPEAVASVNGFMEVEGRKKATKVGPLKGPLKRKTSRAKGKRRN